MANSTSVVDPTTWEGIDFGPIFNGFYWGTVVSLILSGITILQAWIYFPSKDRLIVQLMAGVMIVLDIASTGLVSQGMYYYLIPHFGSFMPLASLVETLSVECTLSVIIILISQLYFAWQISSVAKNNFMKYGVTGLVILFALISFGGGLACSIVMILDKKYVLVTRSFRFAATAGIAKGSSAVSDCIATVALCWTLGSSRTGIRQTDGLIKTLISFIIQRGILVTMIQTVFLIIFFTTSNHTYWLALHVNVTRIYANTFFAMMNGRRSLKKNTEESYGLHYTSNNGSHTLGGSYNYKGQSKQLESGLGTQSINVDKTVIISDM